ncbi:MAG: UDP-glucose 4-epimerase GalE [Flavobacteriales bacterium]
MKKIIITGGAGYIGSHSVVELLNAGYEPIIFDNFSNSSYLNLEGIKKICNINSLNFHLLDCTDFNAMNEVVNQYDNVEALIHFAAFKSVAESVKNPNKYYSNNVNSMKNVIKLCKLHNINKLIFSSSCTVYGQPEKLPVDETTKFGIPPSPYAETKQICEELLQQSNLNSVSLRYFNPIGSHETSLIGDLSDDNLTNLVPIMTAVAAGERKELLIFGNDYNTKDGSCIRDYIHVQDLALSHVKALDFLCSNTGKFIFNIGTGNGLSVFEAIDIFENSNNISLNKKVVERRDGDVESIFSSCDKANTILGWKAKFSVEKAMIDAWNWEKNKQKLD